jgi:hypothetical protein
MTATSLTLLVTEATRIWMRLFGAPLSCAGGTLVWFGWQVTLDIVGNVKVHFHIPQ